MTSKLQEQVRQQYATKCYPATFEMYQRKPVYLVQVFTYQAACALSLAPNWLRSRPPYRDANCAAARILLARGIREARRSGRLCRDDVQRLSVTVIEQDDAYDEMRAEIVERLSAATLAVGKAS